MKPAAFLSLAILFLASCATHSADIWSAVREGNTAEVWWLARSRTNLGKIEPATGMSPLAVAIAEGDVKMAKVLIKAGADIYAESYSDYIHITQYKKNNIGESALAVRRQLLEAGACTDATWYDYYEHMYVYMSMDRTEANASFFDALVAIEEKNSSRLERLNRKDLNNIFIYPGKAGITEKVLSDGYEDRSIIPNHPGDSFTKLYRLHSPLKQAIYRQNLEIVKLLLKASNDPAGMVNRRYTYIKGWNEIEEEYANHSPLTLAMRSGNIAMVKLLLDA